MYVSDGSVLRSFVGPAVADLEHARDAGILELLVARGQTLPFDRASDAEIAAAGLSAGSLAVRQPMLPFVSYPYEWSFSMLRDAALLHLEVLTEALQRRVTLKDGSSYNVQFVGSRAVFIDLGSFTRYEEGGPWAGYTQFCRTFLNPLLFASLTGVPHNAWLRGSAEGISSEDLSRVLSLRHKLRPVVLLNVWLQSTLQRRLGALTPADLGGRPTIKREALLRQVRRLASAIRGLRPPHGSSGWAAYAGQDSYTPEARQDKLAFVDRALAAERPRSVHDVGCDGGDITLIAERYADQVVATDSAHDAIDALYLRLRDRRARILPLLVDAADPSPAQGWEGRERASFASRHRFDLVLALALVHHLRFGANVPLERITTWITSMAPRGIVEFVPRTDPMIRRLLRWRDDVFGDYDRPAFERALGSRASIATVHQIAGSERVLYAFAPK